MCCSWSNIDEVRYNSLLNFPPPLFTGGQLALGKFLLFCIRKKSEYYKGVYIFLSVITMKESELEASPQALLPADASHERLFPFSRHFRRADAECHLYY